MKRLIAYYRVSTNEQGIDGLGIGSQKSTVRAYARSSGAEIVESYEEVESGRKSARPQLAAAIAACRRHKATLVIAKLDRLSRSVAFTAALMDSGIEFVCCDTPSATRLTIHVLAAVAEDEARRIATRTREALSELKAQGVKLGNPNARKAAKLARAANSQAAKLWSAGVRVQALRRRAAGRTLQEVADFLNGRGLLTRRGGKWNPTTISRLIAYAAPN